MDIGGLIILLLIAGVILALVPIDATIRNIILVIIVIAVILSFSHGFGWSGGYGRHWVG